MRKANKLLTALVAAGALSAGSVNADPMYMDLSSFGLNAAAFGGDNITELFETFTTVDISPTSFYIDTDGTAGINTGDTVVDEVSGLKIASLSGLSGVDAEGYNFTWEMSLSYSLTGSVIVAPDTVSGDTNYLGQFTSGTMSFDLTRTTLFGQTLQTFSDVMTLDLVSANGTIPTNSDQALTFVTDVSAAMPGVFFTQAGDDFDTLIADDKPLSFVAVSNLEALNTAPTAYTPDANTSSTIQDFIDDGFDVYSRTTDLGSVDFDLDVVSSPSTLALLGLSLIGFSLRGRKFK